MELFNKKPKKRYGTFTSEKDENTLKAAQKQRLIYMYSAILALALLLFIPQEWAEKSKDIVTVQSAYVIIVVALAVVAVITSYGAARGCNISKPISEKYKPRAGFERATFASQEWFMYLFYLLAAWEIGLLIYGFGVWGLIGAVLSAAGAAFATLSRIVAFRTLKDGLVYSPPPEETAPEKETPEASEQENAAQESNETEAEEREAAAQENNEAETEKRESAATESEENPEQ